MTNETDIAPIYTGPGLRVRTEITHDFRVAAIEADLLRALETPRLLVTVQPSGEDNAREIADHLSGAFFAAAGAGNLRSLGWTDLENLQDHGELAGDDLAEGRLEQPFGTEPWIAHLLVSDDEDEVASHTSLVIPIGDTTDFLFVAMELGTDDVFAMTMLCQYNALDRTFVPVVGAPRSEAMEEAFVDVASSALWGSLCCMSFHKARAN